MFLAEYGNKIISMNSKFFLEMQKTPNMVLCRQRLSGGRLNKKDGLIRYGDSHVKDKTS